MQYALDGATVSRLPIPSVQLAYVCVSSVLANFSPDFPGPFWCLHSLHLFCSGVCLAQHWLPLLQRDGCPKIINLGSAKTDLFYERKKYVSFLHWCSAGHQPSC